MAKSDSEGQEPRKNTVLGNLWYDDANGAILLGASRYFLIRPETLGEVHDQIERRFPGSSAEIMFAAGHTGVSAYLKTLPDDAFANAEELVVRVIETGSNLGWGNMSLRSLDVERKLMELEVIGSVFVRPWLHEPTCHVLRGVFAALGEAVFGGSVISEEIECLAAGEAKCVFMVKIKD